MLVARMTLRRESGRRARSWSSAGSDPWRGWTTAPRSRASGSTSFCTRRISAIPGRKTRTWPGSRSSARTSRIAGTTDSGLAGRVAGRYSTSTGKLRPGTSRTGQSPRNRATGSASRVADITTRIRSGRTSRRTSREQGDRQVAVDAPLVELVEHDGADAFQEGVGQELTVEDALGLDPQAGRRGDPPLEADLVADLAAQAPALLLGDPGGDGPGRDPAGLEHDHARILRGEQARADDRGRHASRLAGTRLRHQDQAPMGLEAGEDLGHARIHGERNHRWSLPAREGAKARCYPDDSSLRRISLRSGLRS